jgi:hypothetical protein
MSKEKVKKCSNCEVTKTIDAFSVNSKGHLLSICKDCMCKKSIEYYRSVKGLIKSIFRTQKKASKIRGHKPPAYTFEELYNWILSQSHFKKLYDRWVESGYKKDLRPSIDRLDDSKGYSFDNIQLSLFFMIIFLLFAVEAISYILS